MGLKWEQGAEPPSPLTLTTAPDPMTRGSAGGSVLAPVDAQRNSWQTVAAEAAVRHCIAAAAVYDSVISSECRRQA